MEWIINMITQIVYQDSLNPPAEKKSQTQYSEGSMTLLHEILERNQLIGCLEPELEGNCQ